MSDEGFRLPGKLKLRAHGRSIVLHSRGRDRPSHGVMKALLWALYLPEFPTATIEIDVGDRYKPDVVALDPEGKPLLWGEAGMVSPKKLRDLAKRYREARLVVAKWAASLEPHLVHSRKAIEDVERTAPFDVISFPADGRDRFITADGDVQVSFDDVVWTQFDGSGRVSKALS
jgi:hypothetical protein